MRKKERISSKKLIARKKIGKKIVLELKRLFPKTKTALNYSNPWELTVAVVLSAQCTDKKVNEVTEKLFAKYPKLSDYTSADKKVFEKAIHSTGFFRNKTKNILASAKIVEEKFDGKVPETMEQLLCLPGVARKTANIVQGVAFGRIEGIAVDTHVKRMALLHGLSENENPEKIERDLMEVIPKKEWLNLNHRLVDYGRKYCPARKHDHENCPLSKVLN